MPNQNTTNKLAILTARIKGRQPTLNEAASLATIATLVESKAITTKETLTAQLCSALAESSQTVRVKLAAHDDSDRLMDEIVTALGK